MQFSADPIRNLTPEEVVWIKKYTRPPRDHAEWPEDEAAQKRYLEEWHKLFPDVDDHDGWPSFNSALEDNETCWWIYAEESCNLDHVVAMVQAFFWKFRPREVFSLTYAETCSRMRVDEFSGGWLVVTATSWDSGNASDYARKAAKRLSALNRRRLSNPKSKYWRPG